MITLALDASTYVGTVAVLEDARVIAATEAPMRGAHQERLMPAVADALSRTGLHAGHVDRIVCGGGPGSFTSLRIAASIAKGLATGWECPLFAVSSLALIVAGAEPALEAGRYLAVLDALRGESYTESYEVVDRGLIVRLEDTRLVATTGLEAEAAAVGAILVGPGQDLDHAPHARGVAHLLAMLDADGPVDLRAWEPSYGRLAEAQVRWEAAHGRPLPER